MNAIIEHMKRFEGLCVVQTMFMTGEFQGQSVSKVGDEHVIPWLEAVKYISPREVMIYTIDRETPASGLCKATHEQLDTIAEKVRQAGIPCQVSY